MKKLIYLTTFIIGLSHMLYAQFPEVKWAFELNDMAFGNAALADLDHDGRPEIVFSTYRNDGRIIALNAENGSILWEFDAGGCADAAPLIYDVDLDGNLEVVVPGSCKPVSFCLDGATGLLEWKVDMHGSDSPPSVADVDGDGMPEIIHGQFNSWMICINGEDGSVLWEFRADEDSWIQTAPAILEIDGDGLPDFVVANWDFNGDHRIMAFRGKDHLPLWNTDVPEGYIYHGAAHADLDGDGKEELVFGDYSGKLMVINPENGELLWDFRLPFSYSISAPVSLADLDGDTQLEIVFFDWFQCAAIDHKGKLKWKYNVPDNAVSFRGCALSDITMDGIPDAIFASSNGILYGISGQSGQELFQVDLRAFSAKIDFELQHGPVVADFDGDGHLEVFVVGGHAEYPDIQKNYGIAYAVSLGIAGGPDWPMFRRDAQRSACVCDEISGANNPEEMTRRESQAWFDMYSGKLHLSNHASGSHFKLFDHLGRMCFHQILACSESVIDLSFLEKGIYIYSFYSTEQLTYSGIFVWP